VPGTSASSRAKLGSSGGMSQPPPGRILLHVDMRTHGDACGRHGPGTGRGITSAPRRAASRRTADRLPVPRMSAGHAWQSPSSVWSGSPASRRRRWLKAWDGASARIRYQVPSPSPGPSPACDGWTAREAERATEVLDQQQAVDGLNPAVVSPPRLPDCVSSMTVRLAWRTSELLTIAGAARKTGRALVTGARSPVSLPTCTWTLGPSGPPTICTTRFTRYSNWFWQA
jgi:hypothetical protein